MLRKTKVLGQRNESAMSIEKPSTQKQPPKVNVKQNEIDLKEVNSNVVSTRIHFSAKTAFGDKSDSTLLWKGLLTQPPRLRKRHIVFRNIEYIISNWTGDGFPEIIYLTLDQFNGYVDQKMDPTDRVAALELSQVNAIIDQSSVRTYQLKYVIRDVVTWQLPPALVDLKVRVEIEGANVELPLPNPMTLNIEIRSQFN